MLNYIKCFKLVLDYVYNGGLEEDLNELNKN